MNLIEKRNKILALSNELESFLLDKSIISELSKVDLKINGCLHLLEIENLTACEISKITKVLRNNLSLRRNIKGLTNLITSFNPEMKVSTFLKNTKRELNTPENIKACIKEDYFDLLKEVLNNK